MTKDHWIDWVQFLLIALLAPLFLFPSMKYAVIFFIVPLAWILRWLLKKSFLERSALDWAIFILLFQVFATCLIVPDLSFSLPKIAGILLGIAFFYSLIALLKTEKLIGAGIILFLAGGFMLSVVGILGMIRTNEKFLDKLSKISKVLPKLSFKLPGAEEGFHPNAVGGTLILIIPLFLILFYLYFRGEKRYYFGDKYILFFVFTLLGLAVLSMTLLLTQSRGSWLALLLSGLLLSLPSRRGRKWGALVILAFIIIYLILLGFNKVSLGAKEVEIKISSRMQLWNLAIDAIITHPYFGIGMNNIRTIPIVGYRQAHVHNHFLHIGAELGIPGLIAYLGILIVTGFICFKIWRKSDVAWMRAAALGLGCGQLAHFIFGMADSIPLGAKVGIFFWFSLALIVAMYNYTIRSDTESI